MTLNDSNVRVYYTTPAYTLMSKDQVVLDGDLVILTKVDDDRDDIDEIFVTGENLSDATGQTEWTLYGDDQIEIWGL